MYAIIACDGRQYKVQEGQELEMDYQDVASGEKIKFDQVLAYSDRKGAKLGRPVLKGASVTAEVIGVTQGEKLVVQKFRRRKNSRRKTGHRQLFTKVMIKKIKVGK